MTDALTYLWLDLEDTLVRPIEMWANVQLLPAARLAAVRELVNAEGARGRVGVFSFAVTGEHEVRMFDALVRDRLERGIGAEIGPILTVERITTLACAEASVGEEAMSFPVMCAVWGKAGTFRLAMRGLRRRALAQDPGLAPIRHVLLDDDVEPEEFSFPDLGLTGRIINVDRWNPP